MWGTILLFAVTVLTVSVLSTDETYTGYILHKQEGNDDIPVYRCLETDSNAGAIVPVLVKVDLDNIFAECQLWTVTDKTDPTEGFDKMLLSVKDNPNDKIALNSKDVVINSAGTNIVFALNYKLHDTDLDAFINTSPDAPIDLAFTGTGRIKAFCLTVGEPHQALYSNEVTTVSFGNDNVCTTGASDWLFIGESQCASDPCKNGGSCTNLELSRDFQCDCLEDFYGDDCSLEKPCVNNPCQNEGICSNLLESNDFECDCEENYCGKDCSQECTLGCINQDTSQDTKEFHACKEPHSHGNKKLVCKGNRCKAMHLKQIEDCESCRPLDCVETSIVQECSVSKSKSKEKAKGSKGKDKGKGRRRTRRSASGSSKSSGSSKHGSGAACQLPAGVTKSCNAP